MPALYQSSVFRDQRPAGKKGFTLIELMIAVSIIAILSAIGMTVYGQAQKIARDSRRKQDLKQIADALNLYYQDFQHYPCVAGAGGGWLKSGTTQTNWITNSVADCATGGSLSGAYLNPVPIDPLKQTNSGQPYSGNTALGYGYFSAAWAANGCNFAAGQSYILVAGLENTSDPETLGNKDQFFCNGTSSILATGYGTNKYLLKSW